MWNNSTRENLGMDNRERSRTRRPEEASAPGRGYMAPGVCDERGMNPQGGTRGCSFMEVPNYPNPVMYASSAGGMSRHPDSARTMSQYPHMNNQHVHNYYPNNPARENFPTSGASSPQMSYQNYSGWNSRSPDMDIPNYPDRGFVIGPQSGNVSPGICVHEPVPSSRGITEPGPPRGIYPLRPYPGMGPSNQPRPMQPYGPPQPAFPPSGFPSHLPPASQPQYPGQPGHISPKPPRPGFPDQPRYY